MDFNEMYCALSGINFIHLIKEGVKTIKLMILSLLLGPEAVGLEMSSLKISNLEQYGVDGWMTSYFTSFSTVFQSYQDGRMTMQGCVQWNPVYG